jgi:membrane-bound ClpP family serine protease
VYWLALGIGLGLLVLSIVLGDVFDFLDFIDIDIGGGDLSITPVLFTAVAAFGAGGLIGIEAFGLGQGGSIVMGLGAGIGAGGLAGLLFAALHRQEAKDPFELSKLVGGRGRCSLAVGPGRIGRVSVTHEGMTRVYSASSVEDIAVGEEVVVQDVVGSQLTVARPDREGAGPQG